MAKGSKLKNALDRYKGVDHKLDNQKKQQKAAEKRKRSKVEADDEDVTEDKAVAGEVEKEEKGEKAKKGEKGAPPAKKAKKNKAQRQAKRVQAAATKEVEELLAAASDASDDSEAGEGEDEIKETAAEGEKEWETDEEDTHMSNLARLADDSSDSEDEEDIDMQGNGALDNDSEDEDEELNTDDEDDIAFSDLESVASDEKGDIIPHQRLTINNTAALQRALKSFALSSKLPFSENQVVVSDAPVVIEDVDDDLNRELAFYKQSLDALTKARGLLKKEGVSFSRPADYFAEMVKSDEHMGKIKQKLIDEAAGKRAAADARRQRDLKKFGKQVQVAKLQERSKEKRDTMEKIGLLKRKRQGADIGAANESDLFDVALEDSGTTAKKDRADRKAKSGPGRPNHKREKRDEKYGFGGKKRFAKSNDATSSADVSKYSVKKMKGGKKGASRPGKSRRSNKP